MFNIIHMLLGALIGREFDNLFFIAVLGLVSHFLLDMLPHWDVKYDRQKFRENGELDIEKKFIFFNFFLFIVGLMLVFVLSRHNRQDHMFFGALMAVSPDLINLLYAKTKNKWITGYVKFHSRIQGENSFLLGSLLQAALLITLVMVLF